MRLYLHNKKDICKHGIFMHEWFCKAIHGSVAYKLKIARHIVYITCIKVFNCQISPDMNAFLAKYTNTCRKWLASAAYPLKFLQYIV